VKAQLTHKPVTGGLVKVQLTPNTVTRGTGEGRFESHDCYRTGEDTAGTKRHKTVTGGLAKKHLAHMTVTGGLV
jgi:hypothetical protein